MGDEGNMMVIFVWGLLSDNIRMYIHSCLFEDPYHAKFSVLREHCLDPDGVKHHLST